MKKQFFVCLISFFIGNFALSAGTPSGVTKEHQDTADKTVRMFFGVGNTTYDHTGAGKPDLDHVGTSIETQANYELENFRASFRTGTYPTTIIAHSQGGVRALLFAGKLQADPELNGALKNIITVDSPVRGHSTLSDLPALKLRLVNFVTTVAGGILGSMPVPLPVGFKATFTVSGVTAGMAGLDPLGSAVALGVSIFPNNTKPYLQLAAVGNTSGYPGLNELKPSSGLNTKINGKPAEYQTVKYIAGYTQVPVLVWVNVPFLWFTVPALVISIQNVPYYGYFQYCTVPAVPYLKPNVRIGMITGYNNDPYQSLVDNGDPSVAGTINSLRDLCRNASAGLTVANFATFGMFAANVEGVNSCLALLDNLPAAYGDILGSPMNDGLIPFGDQFRDIAALGGSYIGYKNDQATSTAMYNLTHSKIGIPDVLFDTNAAIGQQVDIWKKR